MLIEAAPQIFYVTPHYSGYPMILARLDALDAARLPPFLVRRWQEIAPKRAVAELNTRDIRRS